MAQNLVFDYKRLRVKVFEELGSNTELAKRMGITKETLSKKMQGHVYFSTIDIIKACDILGIPCEEIGSYFFNIKEEEDVEEDM